MAVKITCTFQDILDAPLLGAWDRFCEKYGYNPYMINEGLATGDEEVTITIEDARLYGLYNWKKV